MEDVYQQKLAAILFADVVGYCVLIGDDDVGAYKHLESHFTEMSNIVTDCGGRVVQYAGDSFMAEFPTASKALVAAIDVQSRTCSACDDVNSDNKVAFRIGIDLGEIRQDGAKIFGNSVNVAARLESLAQPGGICVSDSVRKAIGTALDVGFLYAGDQKVKNIVEPIRHYHVDLKNDLLKPPSTALDRLIQWLKSGKKSLTVLGVALLAVVVTFGIFLMSDNRDAYKPKTLVKNFPSIAVLPFDNLDENQEHQQFSDGLTNDIITDLSKYSGLFVVAATSTFYYKDKPTKITQIAQELSVRYVLEGSVQWSDRDLRINAQLIDAQSGHHIWAEKYDRKQEEIFAIQNDISNKIVSVIGPAGYADGALRQAELRKIETKPTRNFTAYEFFLKAIGQYEKFSMDGIHAARELLLKAVALDNNYSKAFAKLTWTHLLDAWNGWTPNPEQSIAQAKKMAEKALSSNPIESYAHQAMGGVLLFQRQHQQAISYLRKAVELNPNNADHLMYLGYTLTYAGYPDEAMQKINEAVSRNPYHPGWYYWDIAWAHFAAKRYDVALRELEKRTSKSNYTYLMLAILYSKTGKVSKSADMISEFSEREPMYSIAIAKKQQPFKHEKDRDHYLQALREVGVPEFQSDADQLVK